MIRKDAKLGMGVDERTWEFKCAKPADVTTWISTLRYALWAVNSGDLAREVSANHISECRVAPRLLELCSAHGHVYLPQSCVWRVQPPLPATAAAFTVPAHGRAVLAQKVRPRVYPLPQQYGYERDFARQ